MSGKSYEKCIPAWNRLGRELPCCKPPDSYSSCKECPRWLNVIKPELTGCTQVKVYVEISNSGSHVFKPRAEIILENGSGKWEVKNSGNLEVSEKTKQAIIKVIDLLGDTAGGSK